MKVIRDFKSECWTLSHKRSWHIRWDFTLPNDSRCWFMDFLESYAKEPFFLDAYR